MNSLKSALFIISAINSLFTVRMKCTLRVYSYYQKPSSLHFPSHVPIYFLCDVSYDFI